MIGIGLIQTFNSSVDEKHKSILLSAMTTHKIYNTFMLPVPKIFAGIVVDVFAYHKALFGCMCIYLNPYVLNGMKWNLV
jgi:hypothetical protein